MAAERLHRLRFIEIPRNADSDMGVQPQRLILGQYAYRINS